MRSPTANKLVLRCLWYSDALVNTNMVWVWRRTISLKPINFGMIVATKCAQESLVCQDRHPLPCVCLGKSVRNPNWHRRDVIDTRMTCYRNHRFLHSVPRLPVVNFPKSYRLRFPMVDKIQNAIQGPVLRLMTWGVYFDVSAGIRFLTMAICNTGSGGGYDKPIKNVGLQLLCWTDCTCFRGHISHSGTQSTF